MKITERVEGYTDNGKGGGDIIQDDGDLTCRKCGAYLDMDGTGLIQKNSEKSDFISG